MRYPAETERKLIIKDLVEKGILTENRVGIPYLPLPGSAVRIPLSLPESESCPSLPGRCPPEPPGNGTEQPERPKYELADIFRLYGDDYRAVHSMTDEQLAAVSAVENCRTAVYGFHADICDECGSIGRAYNSCRNRHCPKCQGTAKRKWVQARISQLLPIPYYHATFTLPNLIFPICLYNQRVIYDLLFDCAAETLQTFAADPKRLGAQIGFYGILHTWSQTMWLHPHVHFIVTGGGLNADGEWVSPEYEGRFLFPVRALSKVFRGKFVEGLKKAYYKGELAIPDESAHLREPYRFEQWVSRLVARNWVVNVKPPFSGPEEVISYIGRYTHRVAISNSRIISIENGTVCFSYKDRKDNNRTKEMTLTADQFIQRFLMHVLPHGYHRIRHYGFLSNGNADANTEKIRALLTPEDTEDDLPDEKTEETAETAEEYGMTCPVCGKGKLIPFFVVSGCGKVVKSDFTLLCGMSGIYDDTS